MDETHASAVDPLTPGDLRISIVCGAAAFVAQGPPGEVMSSYETFVALLQQSMLMTKVPVGAQQGH